MSASRVFASNLVSLSRFGRSLAIGTRGSPGATSWYAAQPSHNYGRQIDDPGELAQLLWDFIDELALLRDFLAVHGLQSSPYPIANEELVLLITGLLRAGEIQAHSTSAPASAKKAANATDRLLDQVLDRWNYFKAGEGGSSEGPCTPTGWCGTYVAAAIHAGGVGVGTKFPQSAYQFEDYVDTPGNPQKGSLEAVGFNKIGATQASKPGDVRVFQKNIPGTASPVWENGHIAMCYGSLSDAVSAALSVGVDIKSAATATGYKLALMDPLWISDFVQGGQWGVMFANKASFGSAPSSFRDKYCTAYRHPAFA